MTDVFNRWSIPSSERIEELRGGLSSELSALGTVGKVSSGTLRNLAIYATGSLARREASPHSDLDAFFYVDGCSSSPITAVDGIEIFHAVMGEAARLKFPDFSNGGEFLHFQYKKDVIDHLGSRRDDYINALTSRMLLILESCSLYNDSLYRSIRLEIINRYFVDFHSHSESFKPSFLINDILRFWRTLCINYEHRREWTSDDSFKRAKGHLNNLKLRFSRLLICYSFIIAMMERGTGITVEQTGEIADLTPLDRIRQLDGAYGLDRSVQTALKEYAWFLESMDRSKASAIEWILVERERAEAFAHGEKFIQSIFEITSAVAKKHGYSRFLVI